MKKAKPRRRSKPGKQPTITDRLRAAVRNDVAALQPKSRSKKGKGKPVKALLTQDLQVYQVFRDGNGIVYLRVAFTANGAAFVVNKGFTVELVDIDANSTFGHMLAMRAVPGASVYECAKRLLCPLSDQCTISQRAKEHLTTILSIKELQKMETKKNSKPTGKFGTVTAPAAKPVKGSKAAGTGKAKPAAAASGKGKKPAADKDSNRGKSLDNNVITCKLKENPLREGSFCHAQVAACMKSDGKTVAQAQMLLDKSPANPNKRRLEVSWLTKKGYIKTKEAA
jgi:hypothetical protein